MSGKDGVCAQGQRHEQCIKDSQRLKDLEPMINGNYKRSTINMRWIDRQSGARTIIYLLLVPILSALAAVATAKLWP